MAVNILARRVVLPAVLTATPTRHRRLAPVLATPRPQGQSSLPTLQKLRDAAEHENVSRREPDPESTPAPERGWLSSPRALRLPRLALPQVGAPHWTVKVPALPVGELGELYAGAAQLLTLWNGPNIEDIRRFEGDATSKYSYGWFQHFLTECSRSRTDEARQAFLSAFNTHGAVKLTDEWAALEYFCMKTAYLRLQPGDDYRFCCLDYGWQTVNTCIRDFDTGLVAHVLTPTTKADQANNDAHAPKPPVIVVFRGTARSSNQPEAELAERPTGCQADLDWDGIGFHAFAANENRLLTLVRKYMGEGHRVILAGHSLGGVFAARTMCALTPEEQKNARLRTFNASGLDAATRARGVVPENNIMVRHRDDKLPRAGGLLLDGTLVTTEPQDEVEALYPHGMPLLAANALNGRPSKFSCKPSAAADMSPTLELGRKFLCLVARDRVDI